MNKSRIILSSILLVFLSAGVFVFLTIKNSQDCSQIVIDTFELHSKIDIPNVDHVNCYFDDESKTRISVYDLKGHINLDNFDYVYSLEDELKGIALLTSDESPNNSSLYVASGSRFGRKWTYVVDQKENRLWAELVF